VKFLVIIEETADAVPGRGSWLQDATLAGRLKTKGVRWRCADKDAVDPNGQTPADIKRFIDEARSKGTPRLFLVDGDGKVLFAGGVPSTVANLILLLEKYGG
jgi:hypothetical protein